MNSHSLDDLFSTALEDLDVSERQKAVLRASLTLFARQGFDRTSTKDIATLAYVSQGTVYKRYATKRDILHALLTPFIQGVIPRVSDEFRSAISAHRPPDFSAFLTMAVQNRLAFILSNERLIRIVITELFTDGRVAEELSAKIAEELSRIGQDMAPLFAYYQREGQLVDWPTERILRYLISTVAGYVVPHMIMDRATADHTTTNQAASNSMPARETPDQVAMNSAAAAQVPARAATNRAVTDRETPNRTTPNNATLNGMTGNVKKPIFDIDSITQEIVVFLVRGLAPESHTTL